MEIFHDLNNPAAYSSLQNIYREVKKKRPDATLKQVRALLEADPAFTRHKPFRRKFLRNRVIATSMDSDWQMDLCDMRSLKTRNSGYTYILTVIDVLSKFGWAVPIKKKTCDAVVAAMEKIFESTDRRPQRVFHDRGKEFMGAPFKEFLKKHGIKQIYSTNDTTKASLAERYNRTLKTRLWKYFTHTGKKRYVEVLPKLADAINKTKHRATKMAPIDVNYDNQFEVWDRLYKKDLELKSEFRFEIGDLVRVPVKHTVFKKGYEANFSADVYQIVDRIARIPPVYMVADKNGKKVRQKFYEHELAKVREKL